MHCAAGSKVYKHAASDGLPADDFSVLNKEPVQYLRDLIQDYPLSSHTLIRPPNVLHATAAAAAAPARHVSKTTAHSYFDVTASTRQFVLWEHPTATGWNDIETIALRAFVTWDWLTSRSVKARLGEQQTGLSSGSLRTLRDELIGLIHGLLVGHVMDPHLDMKQVFRSVV